MSLHKNKRNYVSLRIQNKETDNNKHERTLEIKVECN